MRTIREIQDSIKALKAETGVCILAHSYQSPEILEVADIIGDSYKLSAAAGEVPAEKLLLCGVHFMAETAKLLNPEKQVYEANPDAGCPMAEQFPAEVISAAKEKIPGCAVVAYVNTTAAVKAVSDVCVTSSSAVKIVGNMTQKDILFIPDCNLGAYTQKHCPDKRLHFLPGGCPHHSAITLEEAQAAKAAHPSALLLVHPECRPAVTELADYVGATSGILNFARTSENREFIIGTEISIVQHLKLECPEKRFYPLSNRLCCPNMRATGIADVLRVLTEIAEGSAQELLLPEQIARDARRCLDEMLRLGG
ncbi:MAG: quinolinate synthase NadA [Oscillospiraceae bacterium]|nr:quinolinate synthase NadA [Oscillospiraceae bacterium]